jgi:hypothetical protein
MSSAQEPKMWFTLLDGEQHGPYTFTALVRDARSGHLDPEDSVRPLGWEEWRLARDVLGLFEQEELESEEQDADSMEEDTGNHEKWENALRAGLRDVASLRETAAASSEATSGAPPAAANRHSTASTVKVAARRTIERSAADTSTTLPRSAAKPSREPNNRIKNALIVTFSVLAVLGAVWAAISLDIIRVTFLF